MADPLSAFYDPLKFLDTKNYIPIQRLEQQQMHSANKR